METSVFSDNLTVSNLADLYNFDFSEFQMKFENTVDGDCVRQWA